MSEGDWRFLAGLLVGCACIGIGLLGWLVERKKRRRIEAARLDKVDKFERVILEAIDRNGRYYVPLRFLHEPRTTPMHAAMISLRDRGLIIALRTTNDWGVNYETWVRAKPTEDTKP